MIDNQLFTNSFSSLFMVVRVALNTKADYLKEYKQRLIADCVTEQVNVQNEMI